jgi:general secretion pathway protein G
MCRLDCILQLGIRNMKKSFVKFIHVEKGFTLIELLIVLAIIGVLTSFLLANLIGAKAHARDAQRKSDMRQLQSAFEFYRQDQSQYPANGSISICGGTLQGPTGGTLYMQKIPCDPLTNGAYTYTQTGGGTGYTLIVCLENVNDSQKDKVNSAPCNGSSNWSYTLTNP